MKNQVLLLALLCGTPIFPALAAPSISGVSGPVSNSQALTLFGSSFDTKPAAAPIIWDTVESGQFSSAWGDTHDLSVTTSGQRGHSTRCGTLNFDRSNWDGNFTAGSATYPKWFVQYWFKVDNNWDWGSTDFSGTDRYLSNIKLFRLWNPGDNPENFVVAFDGWENQLEFVMENVNGEPRRTFLPNAKSVITRGSWHLFQFEYGENSGVGQSDGQFRAWFDGDLVVNQTNIQTREDSSEYKRPFIIGFSNVWEPASGASDNTPNNFYIDDIYVDNTWSRVEIGDRPLYTDCNVREIQPVLSWSNSQVQIRVNSGAFTEGQQVYIYVVDKNGAMNNTGFPMRMGSVGAAQPPLGGGENPPQQPLTVDQVNNVIKPHENKNARLSYEVKEAGQVQISVHERFGQEIRMLEDSYRSPGVYEVQWDGNNGQGSLVASGIYLIVFKSGEQTVREKVVLIK